MDIVSYVMGQRSVESGGGGGDDPDIVRFRKDIIASEQTVTVSNDEANPALTINPDWTGESGAIDLEQYDTCMLTVDGTDNVLTWGYADPNCAWTKPSENVSYGAYYYEGEYRFDTYNPISGDLVPGDYIVELSKLVPATE